MATGGEKSGWRGKSVVIPVTQVGGTVAQSSGIVEVIDLLRFWIYV